MRILIFFIISISVFTKNNYFWQMNEKQINNKIVNINKNNLDFFNKVKKISQLFLKTPYVLNVLGEGKTKSLYSFKGVDCVTFVETVLAISNSENLKSSIDLLQKIRYKNGEISYNKRNHFMMTQWVLNAQELGVIKEATENISKDIKILKKKITINDFNKKFKKFKKLNKDLPIGEYKIKYIPIKSFIKNLNKLKIKDGTIMMIIRENKKNNPLFTSHLGFIINSPKGKIFRAATSNTRFKEVKDTYLAPYLRFYRKYYLKSWKIIGISLYEPRKLGENK